MFFSKMILSVNDDGLTKYGGWLLLGITVVTLYMVIGYGAIFRTVKAPKVGYRNIFEPTWLVRLRFIRESRSMLQEGYDQVSYAPRRD